MLLKLRLNRRLRLLFMAAMAGWLQWLLLTAPVFSAERIYASYGPLERYILVSDLVSYADTGELPDNLRFLSRLLTSEQLEQLRSGLLVSADIDVVTVSQFLYTAQGEAILQWLGELIQTQGRQNGALGFRGALILAAADRDGGLNALNVLKHFPTQGIRVDLQNLLGVARVATDQINQTKAVTTQIFEQAESTSDSAKANLPFRDLTLPGPNTWELLSSIETSLPTDLYLPEGDRQPLVVVSHGLGGDRNTLAYLAGHLASYGFVVAVVEHAGSNDEQIGALLGGTVGEVIEPDEMVRRPLDIQTLLTELDALTRRDPALRDRLDFQRVGVLGHSMGGYTTLALAGATVDLDTLDQSCPPQIEQLNLSLLLQCLVPSLPQPLPELRDNRVKAAIAINPLDSAVFGPTGMGNIQVPTMMVSGSSDTVTPALPEQIRPFTWLRDPQRYLMLMDGGTHFSTIHNSQSGLTLPEEAIGPKPELAQDYVKAMGVAFLKTYLTEETTYRQYLESAHVASLSRTELPVVLARNVMLED